MEKVETTAIAPEVAALEVQRWLDIKRIKNKKRESNAEVIEAMAEAFEDGTLSLDDDGTITMKLEFPVGEGGNIKDLKFKPRLTVGEINNKTKGIKSTDAGARIVAYMAALTGQPDAIIRKLDSSDYGVGSNIVVFFF